MNLVCCFERNTSFTISVTIVTYISEFTYKLVCYKSGNSPEVCVKKNNKKTKAKKKKTTPQMLSERSAGNQVCEDRCSGVFSSDSMVAGGLDRRGMALDVFTWGVCEMVFRS